MFQVLGATEKRESENGINQMPTGFFSNVTVKSLLGEPGVPQPQLRLLSWLVCAPKHVLVLALYMYV